MSKLTKYLLSLLLVGSVTMAQEEQAGIDLAASFPQFTEGNFEPDLPADGFYWDADNSGWGIGVEIQANINASSGYFLFITFYSFKEDGTPFWCAGSKPYEPNQDVHQWREASKFSNLKYGHNNEQVMSDMDIECHSYSNGPPLKSGTHKNSDWTGLINVNLVWRTPTELEVTQEGGQTHFVRKMSFYDDLKNPSMDWLMETNWAILSNLVSYVQNGETGYLKITNNYNVNTGFELLNADEHQNLKDFVGHKNDWVYYISTVKSSVTGTLFRDYDTVLGDAFTPTIASGLTNFAWLVLIHDPSKNRVMLYTVAGDKQPGELRPDAGSNIKFVADVNTDADVIEFYAFNCEGLPGNATVSGYGENCNMNELSYSISSMADWSPQNTHRSSMKMFKLRTGGKGYLYQKNNGESHSAAELRIENQLIEEGVIPAN